MRIHRLEVEGFGPFRDLQVVDFDAFAHEGIFLIGGRTGAGKSSILDAICFALYGSVPRYEDGEKRLRSDHSALDEPTRVSLEFTSGDRRWRVERVPAYERLKKSGHGTTLSPAEARLWERVDDEWVGRAARPVDVAHELEPILGLTLQQFLQVILLAQGRFARFLLAKNDERQALLRTLFDSHRFGDYEAELERRRREAAEQLAAGDQRVRLVLDEAERLVKAHGLEGETDADVGPADLAGRIAAAQRAIPRADYRTETLDRERAEAERAHGAAEALRAELTALREKQAQRDAARAALARLDAQGPEIAAARGRLTAALAAELLRDPIDRAERAVIAERAALAAADAAHAEWAVAGEPALDADGLEALIVQLTGDLAVAEGALAHERELTVLDARLADTRRAFDALAARVAAIDGRLADFPRQLADLDLGLAAQRAVAAGLDSASAALRGAEERRAAAREAERLAARSVAAEQALVAASAAATDAAATVTELLRRRLAGFAGELAAALVEGQACAVCGSVEHPRPAHAADEPVTADAIDEATQRRDEAIDAERTAAGRAREARDAHAAAAARAGGADVEVLEAAVAAAREELARTEAAGAERDRLAAERDRLAAERSAEETARGELADRRDAERETIARTEEQLVAARTVVDAARGDIDTVAGRIADITRRRGLARALARAVADRAAAVLALAAAESERDARVDESEFDDAATATAALLGASDRAALEAQIADHDVARKTERDRLRDLELELAGTPDEPVDVDAAAAAAVAARTVWTTAVAAATAARQAADAVRATVARAETAHAAIAELAAQHAVIERLCNTVAGRAPNTMKMNLETFVLAAELEEIVTAANLRLAEMSEGRYRLRHTDARAARGAASGLGIEVMDGHTGQARPVQSLSGGETFLASLALALGLAEVVTARAGGIALDTLFIDEGFGSLDPDTLEVAMRTLDELRQGGRTVGVISHVEAMKDELPARLLVEATPQGPSVIRQDVLTP